MLAKQVINTKKPPLYAHNSISEAIQRMNELEVSTLSVVDQTTKKLIGQVQLSQLDPAVSEKSIAHLELEEAVKTYRKQHVFEVARLMLQYEIHLIPVVDKEQTFQGFIEKTKVFESLAHMLNLAEFGSVITVELTERNLTLSEIVHLVESEGAKILGITVEMSESREDTFEVSIKLNLQDVSRVAASLRRYDYTVVTDSGNEAFGMDVETRADELIKYLDM